MSKAKFWQASHHYKSILEPAELPYANKTTRSCDIFWKLGFHGFWQISCYILSKAKSAIPLLFNGRELLSSACDKAKLFAKIFSANSTLILRNQVSFNLLFILELIWKCLISLQLPSSLRRSQPILILDVWSWLHFSGCSEELWTWTVSHTRWSFWCVFKRIFFPDCWRTSSVVPVFENARESSVAKKYSLFSPLFADSKIFEKLDSTVLVDHLEKSDLFPNFQYGFRSFSPTVYSLIVAFNRITRVFIIFRVTWGYFSIWFIQSFWQGLAHWFSSQIQA